MITKEQENAIKAVDLQLKFIWQDAVAVDFINKTIGRKLGITIQMPNK